jgi:hypothetical protein
MNGAYEGDLIRPLGFVTYNFGIAEYELDSFIERLASTGLVPDSWAQRPIGQKIGLLTTAIRTLEGSVQPSLDALLGEVRTLLERRNVLIHGCLQASGHIVSGRRGVQAQFTSVEDLNSLAESIFSWKERLWVYRWRQIEPLLAAQTTTIRPPNTSMEHTREK